MKSINLQDTFLNTLRKSGTYVTVFLLNGFQLKGQVKSYDNFTVLLETEGKQQLIYKHAISTFVPAKNISMNDNVEENA
ncbi:RNA chaperone Hfq [Ureibacillus acetophenoni]|uniref:RNA-binding protein Hfq n=1 Tax=Ureibacillus acetophenoni TaxID=614649 RepID=A0A285U9C3_9BACL|nr:RNA chaperone Hfq [Ureibacillus acetophenoni]SOC38307.1 RNA-binding protein Hfq [Ureibacillus acetophenoni]